VKKQIVISVITLVCILIAIATLSLSCAVPGYDLSGKGLYLELLVIASALVTIGLLLSLIMRPLNVVVTILNLAALCLLASVFANVVLARATLAAAQFTYDSVNALGWQALRYSFVSLGGCLAGELLLVIGAFFDFKIGGRGIKTSPENSIEKENLS
jgi:hypothetical protein